MGLDVDQTVFCCLSSCYSYHSRSTSLRASRVLAPLQLYSEQSRNTPPSCVCMRRFPASLCSLLPALMGKVCSSSLRRWLLFGRRRSECATSLAGMGMGVSGRWFSELQLQIWVMSGVTGEDVTC